MTWRIQKRETEAAARGSGQPSGHHRCPVATALKRPMRKESEGEPCFKATSDGSLSKTAAGNRSEPERGQKPRAGATFSRNPWPNQGPSNPLIPRRPSPRKLAGLAAAPRLKWPAISSSESAFSLRGRVFERFWPGKAPISAASASFGSKRCDSLLTNRANKAMRDA